MNDTVRRAQQSISTPVPEISGYAGGQVYQAIAFLTRQEEAAVEKWIPDGCRFARWCESGVVLSPTREEKQKGYNISAICMGLFKMRRWHLEMLKMI